MSLTLNGVEIDAPKVRLKDYKKSLIEAAKVGNVRELRKSLALCRTGVHTFGVNAKDEDGKTALH